MDMLIKYLEEILDVVVDYTEFLGCVVSVCQFNGHGFYNIILPKHYPVFHSF